MKSSIKTVNDLIKYWYTNETFREILEDLDASSDIWLDIIKVGADINFIPLAYAVIYLYQKNLIKKENIIEFEIKFRIQYNSKTRLYYNNIPTILIDNIQFSQDELTDILKESVREGNYDFAGLLIKKGADYNANMGSDKEGFDAITSAIRSGQIEFFKTILNAGYELNTVDAESVLLFYASGHYNFEKVLEFFRIIIADYEFDISNIELYNLYENDVHGEFLKFLNFVKDLGNPIDLSIIRDGKTLLDDICICYRIDDLKVLLEYGIDINDPSLSTIGPIHAAVSTKYMANDMREMVHILQEAGAKNIHNDNIVQAIKNHETGNKYCKT